MYVARLTRFGHSWGVALPKVIAKRLWLEPGDYMKVEDVVEGILLRPLEPRKGVLTQEPDKKKVKATT